MSDIEVLVREDGNGPYCAKCLRYFSVSRDMIEPKWSLFVGSELLGSYVPGPVEDDMGFPSEDVLDALATFGHRHAKECKRRVCNGDKR
jgi:hypothetical protein